MEFFFYTYYVWSYLSLEKHDVWSYLSLEKHDAKLVLSVGCFGMLVMHGVIC